MGEEEEDLETNNGKRESRERRQQRERETKEEKKGKREKRCKSRGVGKARWKKGGREGVQGENEQDIEEKERRAHIRWRKKLQGNKNRMSESKCELAKS